MPSFAAFLRTLVGAMRCRVTAGSAAGPLFERPAPTAAGRHSGRGAGEEIALRTFRVELRAGEAQQAHRAV